MAVIETGLASIYGGGLRYRKFSISYADIATAGGANLVGNVALFTLPQAAFVIYARVKHTKVFAGVTTLTLSVGVVGALTRFTGNSDDLVGTPVADATLTEGPVAPISGATHAAVGVVAHAISTVSNLDQLSDGYADVYVLYVDVTTPSA